MINKYMLFVLTVVLMLVINGLMLPDRFSYRQYVSGDAGSAILAPYMFQNGVIPYRDFIYNYGMGTLWLNQIWFNIFTFTPLANGALNITCLIFLCWTLVKMITVMKWRNPVILLVMMCTPYIFCYSWFTTVHILEPALIILCLVHYLNRSYASALFLATLALLVKPALAYFVGLYLVIVMLTDCECNSISHCWTRFLKQIAPSAILLLLFSAYVLSRWGWQVWFNSLVPLEGMSAYQEAYFGFFARGKLFWLPDTDNLWQLLEYYVLTPAGVWVAGTLLLTCLTFRTILKRIKSESLSIQERCILICGLLHIIFILVMFGNEWSWTYTSYLPILGIAAWLSTLPGLSRSVVMVIAMMMLMSFTNTIRTTAKSWQGVTMQPDLQYLFVSHSMHQELTQLRNLARKHRVLLLGRQGAPSLILDGIAGAPTWAYMGKSARKEETQAILKLINDSDVVVVPQFPFVKIMMTWPGISEHLSRLVNSKETDLFVYRSTMNLDELLLEVK